MARALAAKPEVVLLDEPFGALDAVTRDALGRDYRKIHDALGLTTVMITHDMMEALLLADRIAVMREGRLIADGSPHDVLDRPKRSLRQRTGRNAPASGAARVGPRRSMSGQFLAALKLLPLYLGWHVVLRAVRRSALVWR